MSKKKPQQVAESVENLKTVVPLPVSKPEKETAVKPDLPSIQKSKKGATPIVPVDVHKPVIEKSAPTQRQTSPFTAAFSLAQLHRRFQKLRMHTFLDLYVI